MMPQDKAGKTYWDTAWSADTELPKPIDPLRKRVRNFRHRQFHALFQRVFAGLDPSATSLLEIGAARSVWLPYFAKHFGFEVAGIDYSETGCQQGNQILDVEGIDGTVHLGDIFAPPVDLVNRFQVVVSFGVVEHFEDTAGCVEAIARFLVPGGLMFTLVPNLTGLIGAIQKRLDRSVFDIHRLIDREELRLAHERAQLSVVQCDYFMFSYFGVCNIQDKEMPDFSTSFRRSMLAVLRRLSLPIWLVEDLIGPFSANRYTSPYVICVARRPQE